jgi:uncharacterized protein YggE
MILFGWTITLAALAQAEPELKGPPAELSRYLQAVPGQINLSASAEIKAEANRAVLRLRINTKDKLLQTALEKNRKDRDEIVHTLTTHGLTKDDIHVSKFSSTPSYGMFSKRPGSYEISSTVEVEAANENDVQAVAALVDSMPELTLESVTFKHTDKDKLQQKAVADALDKLNVEKSAYEEKLGVMLRPRSISPSGGPEVQGVRYQTVVVASGGSLAAAGEPPAPPASADISQFDEVVYQAQVTVTFDVFPLETKK